MNSQIRKIGNLQVPDMGLGCVNLSGLYGSPLIEATEVLNFAFNHSVIFFDTADAYANGNNEVLLADFIKKHNIPREKVIISTKGGVVWNQQGNLTHAVDNSPLYIRGACEASLKRLNTDYIDLYYLHRIAAKGEQIEESMQALAELVKEGKIRHIGLSEVNGQIIRRAHGVYPLTAIQSEYSLMTRDPEINGVLETCRELGIGFVAYSPLCRGLLSGNFKYENLGDHDFRHKFPRFKKGNLENNMLLVNQLESLAKEKNCSVVQLSLAWVLAQGNDVLAIPGTKCIKHLSENIDSIHIKLSENDLAILNHCFPVGVASGARYSPAILRSYNLTEPSK